MGEANTSPKEATATRIRVGFIVMMKRRKICLNELECVRCRVRNSLKGCRHEAYIDA